jgi:hypothetical protein
MNPIASRLFRLSILFVSQIFQLGGRRSHCCESENPSPQKRVSHGKRGVLDISRVQRSDRRPETGVTGYMGAVVKKKKKKKKKWE